MHMLVPETQHDKAIKLGARCADCPLVNSGQGPVMGEVRPGASLAVVGEAPSTNEVEEGKPFVGASGDVLWRALDDGGVGRADVTATNAILCRPPGGNMMTYLLDLKREHKKALTKAKKNKQALPVLHTPQDCCAPRLKAEMDATNARTLLGVGNEGLKALAGYLKLPFAGQKAAPGTPRVSTIKRQHGSPVLTSSGVTLTASLHPAFALHGSNTYLPIIREDLTRAATIARRGGAIAWSEPEFILKPSADACVNVMEMLRASGARLTIDIETNSIDVMTADIRCVGIGATVDEREVVIVVPLKHMTGAAWWSPGDELRIKKVMTLLLEANPLAGHNLLYDTAVLLQHGLLKNRGKKWFDTMIAHHCSDHSELPHDLGFVAARFFEAPRWKEDADHKAVENVDDYWLHLYCAKDVLGEMRLVAPLAHRISQLGVAGALSTDLELAPVARDMGMLGLNINEGRRRQFFDTLDVTGKARREALCRIIGRGDFNPNATKQVSDFLFIQKKLSPPYATDGREWEELADDEELDLDTEDPDVILAKASTNELSLLRLLDLGVDEQTRQFVETLLSYRGIEKCKGTYIGLKWTEDEATAKAVLTDTHRKRGFLRTERWDGNDLSIFHPSWKVHITPTGRWATSPNVQNWPERVVYDTDLYKATDGKDGIINTRSMVEAPPGYVLVGADYAAIELRLYAAQSGDALLLDAILNGKDPHTLNYATMMAKHPSEIGVWYKRTSESKAKKYLRMIAKRFGFLVIYGGQRDKLYKTMAGDRNPDGSRSFPDLQPKDVEMWFDNWHRGHPETRKWQEAVVRAWGEYGFVGTMLDGRKRFFIGGPDPTAMPNMTIQGSAASIMNRAMKRVSAECPYRGWGSTAGVILQVHDYVGLQVPKERQKDAEDLLDAAMPYEAGGMKYIIERKSGQTWDQT
jgi:DNA polymerase I-like protein with 3'-5' exonuclease and polymerase domains/uracil-DNA glycosylase